MDKTPQLENGYIKIANELWEAIMLFDFSKRQYKVIMCILRKTYGFNKKEDKISFSQIAELTGLHRPHAISTIQELVAMGVIKTSDQNSTSYINLYRFNKLFKEWQASTKTVPSNQNGTTLVPKQLPKLVTKTVPTKDNKDNIQKTEGSKERTENDPIKEKAKQILLIWNKKHGTHFTSTVGFEKNLAFWINEYPMEKIIRAIRNITQEDYWMTDPTVLFRKRNPRGEDVDYIGKFLSYKDDVEEMKELEKRKKEQDAKPKEKSLAEQWREKKEANGLTTKA